MTRENGAVEDLTEPRIAVVTGASSGIGLAAATELARRGWTLALVGRDEARLKAATELVQGAGTAPVAGFRCDFEALDEVRGLGDRLRTAYPRIDVLANNAGGMVPARRTTVDGFEATIQSNHLAPFLLSHQLREPLRGGRIINTSSDAHRQGRLDPRDLSSTRQRYLPLWIYGSAKQANILFTLEATRRWPEIMSTSFHPGVVRTNFGSGSPLTRAFYRYMPGLRTPAKGARTLVWLANADEAAVLPGAYYLDERIRTPAPKATNPDRATRLWEASLGAVGL